MVDLTRYNSSRTFIAALKGQNDPPHLNGPSKIEIAQRIWRSDTVTVLNQEEITVEWLLTSLAKDKPEHGYRCLGNASYWNLLLSVLSDTSASADQKRTKLWLTPLLGRVSLASIVVSWFGCILAEKERTQNEDLIESAASSILQLWPVALAKLRSEQLSDCFFSMLQFQVKLRAYPVTENVKLHINRVSVQMTRSFHAVLNNATVTKKILSTFMQHLSDWMELVKGLPLSDDYMANHQSSPLVQEIYFTGADIVFTRESVKDLKPSMELVSAVNAIIADQSTVDDRTSLLPIYSLLYGAFCKVAPSARSAQQDGTSDFSISLFLWICQAVRGLGEDAAVWECLASMSDHLGKLNAASVRAEDDTEKFKSLAQWTSGFLCQTERAIPAIRVLCNLGQFDFDLVDPSVPTVLRNCQKVPVLANRWCASLLRQFLEFYSKTRTLHTYIDHVLESLSPNPLSPTHPRNRDAEVPSADSSYNVLLSIEHLKMLSRSARTFLTPGQISNCVGAVVSAVEKASHNYDIAGEFEMEPKQQRRSKPVPVTSIAGQNERKIAHTESLVSLLYLASAVLPHIPLETAPLAVASDTSDRLQGLCNDTLSRYLRPRYPNHESLEGIAVQGIASAVLRFHHSMAESCSSFSSKFRSPEIISIYDVMLPNMATLNALTLPLALELCRLILLGRASGHSLKDDGTLMGHFLAFLSTTLDSEDGAYQSQTKAKFNRVAIMSASYAEAPFLLLHSALHRWLPILEEVGHEEHMETLAKLFLTYCGKSSEQHTEGDSVSPQIVLSAAIWEASSFQAALHKVLDQSLGFLDALDLPSFLKATEDSSSSSQKRQLKYLSSEQTVAISDSYALLNEPGEEYIRRSLKAKLVTRGIVADVALHCTCLTRPQESQRAIKAMLNVRGWMSRLVANSGAGIPDGMKSTSYLRFLLGSACRYQTLASETDTMFLLLFQGYFSKQCPEEDTFLSNTVSFLTGMISDAFAKSGHAPVRRCILNFIRVISSQSKRHTPATFSATLSPFHDTMAALLKPRVESTFGPDWPAKLSVEHVAVLEEWRHFVNFTRSLGKQVPQRLGQRFLYSYLTQGGPKGSVLERVHLRVQEELLALILAEVDGSADLRLCINSFLELSRHQDTSCLDSMLLSFLQQRSLDEFSELLSIVEDLLQSCASSPEDLRICVHLSCLLGRDIPEGASKNTQKNIEYTLRTCLHRPSTLLKSPALVIEVLRLMDKQCSDRPASIKTLTTGMIWSLLSLIMEGTEHHDAHTSAEIFSTLINISSSLVRLRRDLILETIPMLAMVLQQSFGLLRAMRPGLGNKQRKIVADSLPPWINVAEPLSSPEARSFGRLLESLQTKTTIRSYGSNQAVQKAESLSRPFSKHAAGVMKGYLDILADPLCTLSNAVRRELEPGLFALCNMMSEVGRDSLLISVDTDGKANLKFIWRQYEKQKYTGRG